MSSRWPKTVVGIALLLTVGAAPSPMAARDSPRPTPSVGTTVTSTPSSAGPTSVASAARAPASVPLKVLALGDSVPAGTACGCAPFVATYAALLGARDHVATSATNLGIPGLTTTGLGQQLAKPQVQQSVAQASVIVLTVGANDLGDLLGTWTSGGCDQACSQPGVDRMGAGLARDLTALRALTSPGTRVLVTTYWNVFEDGDVADATRGAGFADWSNQLTLAANRQVCAAAVDTGDACVDLYPTFEGPGGHDNPTHLLADDGDHPNAEGHAAIARTLLAATPP